MSATATPPLTCPEWCAAAGDSERHQVRMADADRDGRFDVVVTHPGPTFGPFVTDSEQDSAGHYPAVSLPTGRWRALGFDTADQLREHAAHALAVAEWLESFQ